MGSNGLSRTEATVEVTKLQKVFITWSLDVHRWIESGDVIVIR